jgi:hypothetical protein
MAEKKENFSSKTDSSNDRIEGNVIFLDENGHFPKKVIIESSKGKREYRLVKTRRSGYILN